MKSFLVSVACFLLSVSSVFATDTLFVAVKHSPPFLFVENGKVSGINNLLFKSIVESLDITYEYKEYNSVDSVVMAVSRNVVDMTIAPLSVTSNRYANMSFTQPIFIGGLGVAQRTKPSSYFYLLKKLFSFQFIEALMVLCCVIFFFGFLLWLVERKRNELQFRRGIKGLLDGIWWSAVTMTTVGYGDKSPATIFGRFIAVVWMFTAIITISSFTAAIASSLTIDELDNTISSAEDLRNKNVGTIRGSSSFQLLKNNFVDFQQFSSISDLLNALNAGEIEYAVYDYAILNYYIHNQYQNMYLQPNSIYSQYYSFAMSDSLPIQKTINLHLMQVLESDEWVDVKKLIDGNR